MAATQKPIAASCLGEKMTKPAWREKPSWFLVAERDRMIAPDTQRYMAHRTGGHVMAIEVDHTPLASAPERVVHIIADAVDAVLHAGPPNPLRIGEHTASTASAMKIGRAHV